MTLTPFMAWLPSFFGTLAATALTPSPVLGAVLVVHLAIFAWGVVDFRFPFFMRVAYRSATSPNSIALTFDDGPDPRLTIDVLKLLRAFGYKATFFVIATKVRQHPDIVRMALADGHTIACHDLNHAWYANFRLRGKMLSEIGRAADIIEEIIGTRPLLYRPPVGLLNPHLPGALKTLNMSFIGWSKSVRDAGNRRRKRLSAIPELAAPGEVLLLHDVAPNPCHRELFLEQLEKLLFSIKQQGLEPVGVDKLLGLQAYA